MIIEPNNDAEHIFNLWMDEIGGLVVYLDEKIAQTAERQVRETNLHQIEYLEGMLTAYNDIRDML